MLSLDLSTSTSTARCCAPFFNTEGWCELIQKTPLGPTVPVQSKEETQFGKLEMLGLLFSSLPPVKCTCTKKSEQFFAPHSDLKKEAQASLVSAQCSASINTSLAIQLPVCWQIWCHLLRPPSGCNGISALRPALGPQSLSHSPSPLQIDCQNYHLLRGGFHHNQNGQEIRRPSSQVRQLKTGERKRELHRWQKSGCHVCGFAATVSPFLCKPQ